MTTYGLDDRLQEILSVHEEHPVTFPLTLIMLLVGILLGIGFNQIVDFGSNLYIEIVSIVVTVGFIDVLNRYRDRQQQKITQRILARNEIKSIQRPREHGAFFEMAVRGLLKGYKVDYVNLIGFRLDGQKFDGLRRCWLERFNMTQTIWAKIDFSFSVLYVIKLNSSRVIECRFRGARINHVEMNNAHFSHTSFRDAKMETIHMQRGEFFNIDFRNAKLTNSTFEGVIFYEIDMRGADLTNTNLRYSNFSNIQFNGRTLLPDGTRCKISEDIVTQLAKFTNPSHPEFHPIENGTLGFLDFPEAEGTEKSE